MNKQDLKFQLKQDLARLQNSVFRVIATFPDDKNWHMGHVRIAVKKLVENPELSTEQVIKSIKRSHFCARERWFIDREQGYKKISACKDSKYCKPGDGGCSNWAHCVTRDEK